MTIYMTMKETITRHEVLFLNELVPQLPADVKDFEYQLCIIENTERLAEGVKKIREAIRAAADPEFLRLSDEYVKKAYDEGKDNPEFDVNKGLNEVLKALTETERETFVKLREEQSKLENEFLEGDSDIKLFKINKDKIKVDLPLDRVQSATFRYLIQ